MFNYYRSLFVVWITNRSHSSYSSTVLVRTHPRCPPMGPMSGRDVSSSSAAGLWRRRGVGTEQVLSCSVLVSSRNRAIRTYI